MTSEQDRRLPLAAVAVALVAALCYANSLANGYTFDDQYIVAGNDLVRAHSFVGAFTHLYWPPVVGAGQYRPLVIASFVLDWGISHGAPWWFHLVNVLWHVAASVLVWRLLEQLMPPAGALAGALLFAVHPVHVEAISNIVGRSELMMTVGVLAALLAHRRGHWSAVPWFALAILSKESGIVFVGLAALHDARLTDDWRTTFRARRPLYAAYGAVAMAFAAVFHLVAGSGKIVVPALTWIGASTGARWLTMLGIVPEYARLLLVPLQLRVEYGPAVTMLATGLTLPIVLGVFLLVLAALVLVRSWQRAPVVAVGLLWFVIAISPVSNVLFPSGIVLAERTLYLPSVGAAMIAGWLVCWAAESGRQRSAEWAVAAICLAFAVRSWTRTPIWHDNKAMFVESLRTEPESYRLHVMAALVFAKANRYDDAANEYRTARMIYTHNSAAYSGAAECALTAHDDVAAAALLDSAIAQSKDDYYGYMRLAEVREMQKDWPAALASAKQAVALAPDTIRVVDALALAAWHLRDFADADAAYRRAMADLPNNKHLRHDYAAMVRARDDTAARRAEAIGRTGS